VKDNLDTADMPTSSGVALFKDFVPPKDAFIVARLRAAGAKTSASPLPPISKSGAAAGSASRSDC